ncbi:MAG: transposase [Candidatus Vogelbacteria bacterium]|nr:transposase [Candidatus Vogelbacteria bacterium]
MERKIEFAIDEYYHIYSRGNDKRNIFLNHSDYNRFIKLLYLCNSTRSITVRDIPPNKIFDFDRQKTLVSIGSYCLMPNHFHLLIREHREGGTSLFMKKLLTAYSMYFNLTKKRRGSLFESRFQAQYIDADRYLKYLFSYIHLNPVKLIEPNWREDGIKNIIKTKKYLSDYRYSSYQDYIGDSRQESRILDQKSFPTYFESNLDFEQFLEDWLNYNTLTTTEDGPLW